jgi:mono/diheme cytochrome c family protein
MRVAAFLCAALLAGSFAEAQAPAARGQQTFVSRCAGCHGTTGNGGELGPAIAARIPARTDQDLTTLFREGLPNAGMP